MASSVLEVATGTINGVNRIFTSSGPYRPGSVAVFLNGILQSDNYTESAPSEVTMDEAPLSGDVLQLFYILA